jgi:hypothetical protein
MTGSIAETAFAPSIERKCIFCLAFTGACGVEVPMKPIRIVDLQSVTSGRQGKLRLNSELLT